jgi:phosphoribosylaminoimidazole-succinocarboxamide synthase
MTKKYPVVYANQMLYRFHSKNSPECLMLEDLTLRIFQTLERELSKKGILLVDQLPSLITKLEDAIAQDAKERQALGDDQLKSDRLGQRAFPFLKLLKASLKKEEVVVWGV